MELNAFIVNIVVVTIIEIMASLFLPEGKMKKIVLSVISLYLFFAIVYPLCELIKGDGLYELLSIK